MCNACILSRFVYIFTNKPTWLEYTEKKKTWQLWILFCPVRQHWPWNVQWAVQECRWFVQRREFQVLKEREQQIKWLYRCIWSTPAFLHHNNNTGLLQVTKNTLWCLNFVKWGKKKRCLCLHKTPLQNVNVSSVFLINLSSIITILWLLMFVASATWSVTC